MGRKKRKGSKGRIKGKRNGAPTVADHQIQLLCTEHGLVFTGYCSDCHAPICDLCGHGGQDDDEDEEELEEEYETLVHERIQKIRQEQALVRARMKEFMDAIEALENDVNLTRQAINQQVAKMANQTTGRKDNLIDNLMYRLRLKKQQLENYRKELKLLNAKMEAVQEETSRLMSGQEETKSEKQLSTIKVSMPTIPQKSSKNKSNTSPTNISIKKSR